MTIRLSQQPLKPRLLVKLLNRLARKRRLRKVRAPLARYALCSVDDVDFQPKACFATLAPRQHLLCMLACSQKVAGRGEENHLALLYKHLEVDVQWVM